MTDPDQQPLKFQTQEEEMICEYLYIINHSTFLILVPWDDKSTHVLFVYLLTSVFTQKFHNLLFNDNNENHHLFANAT
jgi:hypothetical protein